jgi:hypothetical protein
MKERIFRRLCAAGLAGLLPLAATSSSAEGETLQFPTPAAAGEHCPGEVIVWVDLETHVFYYRGQDRYGSTKQGAYMCQRDLKGGGFKPNRSGR